jgi:hypothetical protein
VLAVEFDDRAIADMTARSDKPAVSIGALGRASPATAS